MSEPWTGAEHEPRNPDEWWVGCVCGNNHTVSWFRSQWAGRAVQDDGLPSVEALRRALLDLAQLDYAYDARLDSGDYGLLERPSELADRILKALRAAPPLHDPQEPER